MPENWTPINGTKREDHRGCLNRWQTSPCHAMLFHGLDWIIAGGESGPHARPAHPDWFRLVRDQCAEAGVPFFFKQWGEWAPYSVAKAFTGECVSCELGPDEQVRVGKRAAGHLLDGREYREFPRTLDGEVTT